jgi:hypothetical protein
MLHLSFFLITTVWNATTIAVSRLLSGKFSYVKRHIGLIDDWEGTRKKVVAYF